MSDDSGPIRTTKMLSVSIPVSDQDAAKRYYCDVLGFDLLTDEELWPGARWLEVGLPGSDVSIALLDATSGLPIGVRLGTADVDHAHCVVKQHDSTVRDEVLRLDFAPPMFEFVDPDGNVLVYLQDPPAEG